MLRIALSVLTLLLAASVSAQSGPPLFVDGTFSDWQARQPAHVDPSGDGHAGTIDLRRLWIDNDETFLFLAFETGDSISIQNANDLRLLVDADADEVTGHHEGDLGAEFVWRFGKRTGSVHLHGATTDVTHHDMGVFTAPTVTSDRFEVALRRDATVAGRRLFRGDTIRLALATASDRLPDESAVTYVLTKTTRPPLPEASITRGEPQHLRVVSYNVWRDRIFDEEAEDAYRRILGALEPDVVGFQEIYDHSPEETAARVAELLGDEATTWHAAGIHDNVAVSRFPISRIDSIGDNGAFVLDTDEAFGSDLLFVVGHTPCCDRDAERQDEIDQIMAYVRDTRAELPGGTPIVIAGDMNLVGDARQVATLRTGDLMNEATYGPDFAPDWDGTPLTDLAPWTTGLPMNITWYDPDSSFGPGRLDAILYTDSVLEAINSFVLFTPGLSAERLGRVGLRTDDTVTASDHLPLVVDFAPF